MTQVYLFSEFWKNLLKKKQTYFNIEHQAQVMVLAIILSTAKGSLEK